MKTALIIAPHPDDAELAMGGTISKMIEQGWDITVVDLTDGEPTPLGSKRIRKQETDKASEILGIRKRICLDLPNRTLQATHENRRKVAEVIRLCTPDFLFGPVTPDWHPDHVAAAELVDAARFEAKFHKTQMAGVPHWTPKRYGYYSTHRLEFPKPSFIADITDYWDQKLAAINAYQSQIKSPLSSNQVSLVEKTEVACRYFGQCAAVKYGEPFFSYEPMCIDKLELLANFH